MESIGTALESVEVQAVKRVNVEGRGFKSLWPCQATRAYSSARTEYETSNLAVGGSNPSAPVYEMGLGNIVDKKKPEKKEETPKQKEYSEFKELRNAIGVSADFIVREEHGVEIYEIYRKGERDKDSPAFKLTAEELEHTRKNDTDRFGTPKMLPLMAILKLFLPDYDIEGEEKVEDEEEEVVEETEPEEPEPEKKSGLQSLIDN